MVALNQLGPHRENSAHLFNINRAWFIKYPVPINCDWCYVGETGRYFAETRKKEHSRQLIFFKIFLARKRFYSSF